MVALNDTYLEQLFFALTDINNNIRKATFPEPDGAGVAGDAVTVTANAAADTWGAYVQLVATVGVGAVYITEVI